MTTSTQPHNYQRAEGKPSQGVVHSIALPVLLVVCVVAISACIDGYTPSRDEANINEMYGVYAWPNTAYSDTLYFMPDYQMRLVYLVGYPESGVTNILEGEWVATEWETKKSIEMPAYRHTPNSPAGRMNVILAKYGKKSGRYLIGLDAFVDETGSLYMEKVRDLSEEDLVEPTAVDAP